MPILRALSGNDPSVSRARPAHLGAAQANFPPEAIESDLEVEKQTRPGELTSAIDDCPAKKHTVRHHESKMEARISAPVVPNQCSAIPASAATGFA